MGINDTEGNTGKRQATIHPIRPEGPAPWHMKDHEGAMGAVTWAQADAVLLRDVIEAVTSTGAAISLSATRDQRGVSITILDGPDRPKFYASSPEELKSLLRRLTGAR